MGSTLTCLCASSSKDQVAIMNEKGGLIKFKKGVLAKEVIAAHQGYKIVGCGSDRTVVSDSSVLQTNRLYFLVPEQLVLQDEIYDKFYKLAQKRGFIRQKVGTYRCMKRLDSSNGIINGQVLVAQLLLLEAAGMKRTPWRPRLQTIPEVISPNVNVNISASLPVTPTNPSSK